MTVFAQLVAHPGQPLQPHDVWQAWNFSPSLWHTFGLLAWLYWRGRRVQAARGGQARWRTGAFVGAWLALVIALVSPVDRLAGVLLSAHMLQHILLILAAAPLLAASAPLGTLLKGLPRRLAVSLGRRWKAAESIRAAWQSLSHPASAWTAHLLVLLVWHVPIFYEAALRVEWLHQLEHVTLFGTAWLFWWVCLHPPRTAAWLRGPGGVLYVFTMALPTGLLGALMTLSSGAWYATYRVTTPSWGASALGDQQLAGAVMWVPAGLVYLAVGLLLLAVWLLTEERSSGVSL